MTDLFLAFHYSWAAKEATIKAVKPRAVLLREIEIIQERSQSNPYAVVMDCPTPTYQEQNYEDLPEDTSSIKCVESSDPFVTGAKPRDDLDGQMVRLSISHEEDYVVAIAMALPLE